MTVHYGAPKGAHIGECHNLIKPTPEAPWSEARYCKTPTIALGGEFPLDRDICQVCAMRGEEFRQRIAWSFARSVASVPASAETWLSNAEEDALFMDAYELELLRTKRSLIPSRKIRVDLARNREYADMVRTCINGDLPA